MSWLSWRLKTETIPGLVSLDPDRSGLDSCRELSAEINKPNHVSHNYLSFVLLVVRLSAQNHHHEEHDNQSL